MARIEELVDEDHQSLNVRSRSPLQDGSRSSKPVSVNSIPSSSTPFSTPSAPNGSSNLFGPAPALPPQMVSAKAHSIDEVAAYLKRTPLFMTSLDAESTEDNPELEAMRALQYEGTRAEIAQGFRESGNEMAKVKKWADGKEFYTKALAALRAERKEDEEGGEQEDRKERDIEEACYSNRALCNLELSTFTSQQSSPTYQKRDHVSNNTSRKLPILHARLCIDPPPQQFQHQSLLPFIPRAFSPQETPGSSRCLQARARRRLYQHSLAIPPPKDQHPESHP